MTKRLPIENDVAGWARVTAQIHQTIEHVVGKYDVEIATTMLACLLAGLAVQHGLPPHRETQFIRKCNRIMRAAFDRRVMLEVSLEKEKAQ